MNKKTPSIKQDLCIYFVRLTRLDESSETNQINKKQIKKQKKDTSIKTGIVSAILNLKKRGNKTDKTNNKVTKIKNNPLRRKDHD